jgi:hypothetical protein
MLFGDSEYDNMDLLFELVRILAKHTSGAVLNIGICRIQGPPKSDISTNKEMGVLKSKPRITRNMVELARWMLDFTVCDAAKLNTSSYLPPYCYSRPHKRFK